MKTELRTKIPSLTKAGGNRVQKLLNGKPPEVVVELPALELRQVTVQIKGISPLIVHNWSEKAIRQMLDKQTKTAVKGREPKNPFEDFRGSLYPLPKQFVTPEAGYGVPAPAFKAAAVTAANDIQLKMTEMRRAFHVTSYTVPIIGVPLQSPVTEWDEKYSKELAPYHRQGISMRMDVVRLESGVADLRFRAWYPEWKASLNVEYNASIISLDQLFNLFRAAGYGCGICEWRPSAPQCRSGEFGRFSVLS